MFQYGYGGYGGHNINQYTGGYGFTSGYEPHVSIINTSKVV